LVVTKVVKMAVSKGLSPAEAMVGQKEQQKVEMSVDKMEI
jgi:hypothetical protein